jgi:hypothetical protein
MNVMGMVKSDYTLYIYSTHQPTKKIPRNGQVWKAVGWASKLGSQDILRRCEGLMVKLYVTMTNFGRQFVYRKISGVVCR